MVAQLLNTSPAQQQQKSSRPPAAAAIAGSSPTDADDAEGAALSGGIGGGGGGGGGAGGSKEKDPNVVFARGKAKGKKGAKVVSKGAVTKGFEVVRDKLSPPTFRFALTRRAPPVSSRFGQQATACTLALKCTFR